MRLRRGRNLEKLGLHSSDTSELFFNELKVPESALLGGEDKGFISLMEELPRESLPWLLMQLLQSEEC